MKHTTMKMGDAMRHGAEAPSLGPPIDQIQGVRSKNKVFRVLAAAAITAAIGRIIAVAIANQLERNAHREYKREQSDKLDERLAESMDASDAVAKY